ncbi:Evolutionarily conserved signaling intermediate in Toll pathway, mitochondrial [Strongyloides ratti]|uniref:Evolutionarily conserved signaling intermediate in Toll pathway, mitochondrial n=1 Tax=Strongyloides ratti TaxID=34506 RepID=A0A090LKL3_STRRB|nr:Evolutionarily conserved signaling intermediate in Toll pathway, mitochondrial [Strongyloides ratti]CEF70228.1 Evolutionarily conserved signaling intermediate in Toll pathway, mitochondrial [Strongyloides ratti]
MHLEKVSSVQPGKDVHEIVALTFGQWNFATKKIKRMLYWMPKIRHTNKYLDKREIDNKKLNAMELAELALKMMSRDAGTKISDAQSVDKNGKVSFIVIVLSCVDPEYRENESTLLDNDSYYNLDDIVYGIEKEFKKTKNIHQQGGKVILALAVLEDNSRESAMAWMKHLQDDNSNLEKATILFSSKTSDVDVI